MESENRNDEIDLIEVFFKTYLFLKKNFWILLISLSIGAALGYSYKFIEKEYYESEMLMESYTISEELRINYIKQFQRLLDDKNYEILKSKTGLEVADLKNIKNLSSKTDGNKKNENILFLYAQVWDSSVLPKLTIGIQSFMYSYPYVRDEIELIKKNSKSLINDIELFEENSKSNINDIDIFIIDSINPSNRNYYVSDIGKDEFFYNEIVNLLKKKQNITKRLIYALPFRVIQDFTIYKNPVNKSKKNAFLGAFIFIIGTLIVLILLEINKKVN